MITLQVADPVDYVDYARPSYRRPCCRLPPCLTDAKAERAPGSLALDKHSALEAELGSDTRWRPLLASGARGDRGTRSFFRHTHGNG